MPFVANFPFFSIFLPILTAIACVMLSPHNARRLTTLSLGAVTAMSGLLLAEVCATGSSITYMMGHSPSPFGNELRFGPLEALMALCFSVVMLLSATGGVRDINQDIPQEKISYYYIIINLLMASMLALNYTNDLFTAYVFIEIITIGACASIMIKPGGKTLIATMIYLFMSLIGSALLLLGISLLYTVTGHLLMPGLQAAVQLLVASGNYNMPLFIIIGLFAIALAIKSALYPFHTWLPISHAQATTTSSAMLSGLIVKCYVFLFIKIAYRIFTMEVMSMLHVTDMLMALGVIGLVMGSLQAGRERDIKRMLSYSTVAQMGYIAVGVGLGTKAGLVAALFHIIAHAVTKPMLFTAAGSLIDSSDHHKEFRYLRGAALRDPLAGFAFVVGSLSMIGIPLFAGFISKMYLATAAMHTAFEMAVIIATLLLSTLLNAMYYVPLLVLLYAKPPGAELPKPVPQPMLYRVPLILFILINLALGLFPGPVLETISVGLDLFV